MNKIIPLEPDNFYHVYNHANGNDNIFYTDENYKYFLEKFKKYISPLAHTLAYCLMPNHFHFLIKIKEESDLFNRLKENEKNSDETIIPTGLDFNPFSSHIGKQFSNFFNTYAQAINKQEKRMGSLFNRPFKRRQITSEKQLRNTILYIHANPVHHGFAEKLSEWKYSSYHSLISNMPTLLIRNQVINLFDDIDNFVFCHKSAIGIVLEEMKE